ncbi:MAG: DUF3047 domain-containing protein [Betaproteobacteria bacterium]|jgi:hypothetical protein|nr:DUF3047 domain-containing protein [Betaproteobacteria bacterium]MCC7215954.1 DUF3047 domain-containing protein [Burkholderiales bacterium]
MRSANALILAVAAAAALAPAASPPAGAQTMQAGQLVTPFSAAKPGTALPQGWEPLTFGSLKTPTKYDFVENDGTVVARARADGAAGGLNFPVKFDIRSAPFVEYRWKIAKLIDGADNRVAAKEDSPVRLVLGFDGDKAKLTFKERTASALAKSATGKDLPYAQLIYIWSNGEPVGTVIENSHTRRVRMVVAATGAGSAGKWVTISRNVQEDFKRAFGEEPGTLTDVGIMTDTDNTGASVEAWYGDIRFLAAKP